MRRERISGVSQAASVIGWVSNTDAIFLGLILTLAVTIFIYGKFHRSETKNDRLQSQNAALVGQLATSGVSLTKQQFDQTKLLGEKQSLVAQLEELNRKLAQQREEYERMSAAERERFQQFKLESDRINEEYRRLGIKAEKLQGTVAITEQDRKRLAGEIEALKTILANKDQEYRVLKEKDYLALKEKEEAIRLLGIQAADILKDLKDRDTKVQATTGELADAKLQLETLRLKLANQPAVHRELVGLKGKLRRVALLFDTSGSMKREGRWQHACGVVATWLDHLDMDECVLILFSTDAHALPTSGKFVSLRGPDGQRNKAKLLEKLQGVEPEGGTNTLAALQLAYKYRDLDTILLFTDGEPNDGNSADFDPQIAEKIYALCRQHNDIPVNTIGLGDYFRPELSHFLIKVAKETGGNFLGR
jgi:Mg-chelatase subunit ChlD